MIYLLIALINTFFGILMIIGTPRDSAGYYLVFFIAGVLTILGLIGIAIWLWRAMSSERPENSEVALKNWLQITRGIDLLLILGLLFRAFVLQPFLVDGSSMEPNFHNRQFILVDRLTYHFQTPDRGEVIIFKFPKNPQSDYIKRIIGLPGDTIDIKDNQVYVNNQQINENYLDNGETTIAPAGAITFTKTVGQDEYFVMGDNRNNSSDSRDWGLVPKANIIGRAWFVAYPMNYFGLVKNPTYNLTYNFNNYVKLTALPALFK